MVELLDAHLVLPVEPVGRVVQVPFQRNRTVETQFPANVSAFVIERLPVIVSENPVDAGWFHSQDDQAAEPDFVAGQVGKGFLQPGEQPRIVEIGQDHEFIAHGTPFSPCRGENAVEPLDKHMDAVTAEGGGVHDVGQQIDQDADGRFNTVAVSDDESEQFPDFSFPAI